MKQAIELLINRYVKIGKLDNNSGYYSYGLVSTMPRCVELLRKLREHSIFQSFPLNEKTIFSAYIDQKIENFISKINERVRSLLEVKPYKHLDDELVCALNNIKEFLNNTKKEGIIAKGILMIPSISNIFMISVLLINYVK